MTSDGWNIHGWIALPIETMARNALALTDTTINSTFLSADRIEAGSFVEAMLYLLRQKHGLQADLSDFARACQPLLGKALQLHDREAASSLLAHFETLYAQTFNIQQPSTTREERI